MIIFTKCVVIPIIFIPIVGLYTGTTTSLPVLFDSKPQLFDEKLDTGTHVLKAIQKGRSRVLFHVWHGGAPALSGFRFIRWPACYPCCNPLYGIKQHFQHEEKKKMILKELTGIPHAMLRHHTMACVKFLVECAHVLVHAKLKKKLCARNFSRYDIARIIIFVCACIIIDVVIFRRICRIWRVWH